MKEKISSHPYPTRVSQKPHCGSPNVINQRDQVSSYGHQNNGVYTTTVLKHKQAVICGMIHLQEPLE